MKIKLDVDLLRSDVWLEKKRLAAIAKTVTDSGEGEVIVSMRKKMPHEKKRAAHGRIVTNYLAAKGIDPFDYPPGVQKVIEDRIAQEVQKALDVAAKTSRPQDEEVRKALEDAAEWLAAWAKDYIEKGGLGPSTGKYGKFKSRMVAAGIATGEYGDPPPRGVLTGRYVKGIRHRWKLGGKSRRRIR